MKIGVIGSGTVGQALAQAFRDAGHDVALGTRDASKLAEWSGAGGQGIPVRAVPEAAAHGELVVLATSFAGARDALRLCGPDHLRGKILIDVTNPLQFPEGGGAPVPSVAYPDSAGTLVQSWAPESRVVKCFNIITAARMANPHFEEGTADMFIAGNDAQAKEQVSALLAKWEWPVIDLGDIGQSWMVEALAFVWITYGFRTNTWSHALKLLRR